MFFGLSLEGDGNSSLQSPVQYYIVVDVCSCSSTLATVTVVTYNCPNLRLIIDLS